MTMKLFFVVGKCRREGGRRRGRKVAMRKGRKRGRALESRSSVLGGVRIGGREGGRYE